jgi:hypothetical protein
MVGMKLDPDAAFVRGVSALGPGGDVMFALKLSKTTTMAATEIPAMAQTKRSFE